MKRRGWLIALCVMALMVGAFYGAATLNARQATQEQRALLEDAITRALVPVMRWRPLPLHAFLSGRTLRCGH